MAHYAIGGERAVKVEHLVHVPPPPPAPEGCMDENPACQVMGEAEAGWRARA